MATPGTGFFQLSIDKFQQIDYTRSMEKTMTTITRKRKFQTLRPRELPNRVREYRIKKGVSLRECGLYVGVTAQAIFQAETKDRGLITDKWLLLASFLECELSILKSKPHPP